MIRIHSPAQIGIATKTVAFELFVIDDAPVDYAVSPRMHVHELGHLLNLRRIHAFERFLVERRTRNRLLFTEENTIFFIPGPEPCCTEQVYREPQVRFPGLVGLKVNFRC